MLKRISVSLILGANLCTILLLWLCVALTFVSPSLLPRFSLLTLVFPIFLCADVLFFIFWLLFYARLAWVPVAGALLVGGYIIDYCPLHYGDNSSLPSDGAITILSYNVGRMDTEERRAEMLQYLKEADADIVCLQEVGEHFFSFRQMWLDSASYQILQSGNVTILSRLRFLSDTLHINYPTRTNRSTACWVDWHGDSLLIVNNHLESNHLSPEEKDAYASAITDPHKQTIQHSSRLLLGKLSEAASYRGAQTDSICAFIDRYAGYSTIVCGDFNDTPISYTYQQIDRRLTSAYRQAGNGPGFTFTRRSFPVRIDHLFFSKDWECDSCCIDRTVSASDHYPVTARLRKKVR